MLGALVEYLLSVRQLSGSVSSNVKMKFKMLCFFTDGLLRLCCLETFVCCLESFSMGKSIFSDDAVGTY